MFRRRRLSVRTNHGLSEDFPDVLSSSQLFSIVLRHYTPDVKVLSILSDKFSNFSLALCLASRLLGSPFGGAGKNRHFGTDF